MAHLHRSLAYLALFCAALLCVAASLSAEETGIRAPAGFRVELFAGDELAHDIFSMTLDRQGRVVVAGRDYIKTLHDDDGDGRAERASLYSSQPKSGAHGMLFVPGGLLATGDEALWFLPDADDDGQTDGEPIAWAKLRHPEHGANGIARGPDGWIYVICGNDAGVTSSHATTAGSPVKEPNSGAVVRFAPDGSRSEIVAHGFRNPYDLDFNAPGNLFTVDADGERDHHLPWYAPTRLFDVASGTHHGWVLSGWQRSWNRPAYFPDSVERLVEIGRGSPTGLAVYRHTQFPERYRGSVLACCWTLGRVYHMPLVPQGSTYTSPQEAEVFLETTGEVGFAPVDIAVGKEGALYVAIGGRRTRGSVFRVTYEGPQPPATEAAASDALRQVLAAPQPLAAWSRAVWEPQAREAGQDPFVAAALESEKPLAERLRAVEVLTDLFGGLPLHAAAVLVAADEPELAARALWSLARQPRDADALKLVVAGTRSENARVQRAAWEALLEWNAMNGSVASLVAEAAWESGFASPDRRVQMAALLADARRDVAVDGNTLPHLWRLHFRGRLTSDHFAAAAKAFEQAADARERLAAVRLMELALGDINTGLMKADVYAGYALNAPPEVVQPLAQAHGTALAASFPTGAAALDMELARLLAMLAVDDAELVERMAGKWSHGTPPHEDLHYLICLSRLPGKRSSAATERVAAGLAGVQIKMQRQGLYVSRNWPARVGEAAAQLVEHDPALPEKLIANEAFRLPSQAFLARNWPAEQQAAAARKLIRAVEESDGELRWSDDLVTIARALPREEMVAALRLAWDDFALRDAIVAVLADAPQSEDRGRFIAALASVQASTVEAAARALASLPGPATSDEIAAAIVALRQACLTPEHSTLRRSLASLLTAWSGQALEIDDSGKRPAPEAYRPWFDWFAAAHADAAARLAALGTVDGSAWRERIDRIDWDAADAGRGRLVFEKKACQKCHAGNSPLGPDLAGAASRLSRADLIAAIIDPSKDVSPLYQTTQVITGSGRVVTGLIVYESPDSTLVQTDADTTVRVAGDEIVGMRKSRVSLMPAGLLNDVADHELADLLAYLKTLGPRR